MRTSSPARSPWWVFWAFFVGFAVKVPMFPFHTWLPDAHTEAPTAGSVVLASVLLKMGTYGFLRFSLPLLPDSAKNPTIINAMAVLSIIGIVYGALACLMQKDWKKLVAYSSVSHLGFCTLGIFALNPAGISGSIIQQINHGISTGMLFLIVGVVYERRHTREISEYGGLLKVMPVFTIIFLLAALSSMGMPPLERLHRRDHDPGRRVPDVVQLGVLGRGGNRAGRGVPAVAVPADHAGRGQGKERAAEGPLVARDRGVRAAGGWAFWIGLNPQPYFRILDRPVAQIVERVRPGLLRRAASDESARQAAPTPRAALR